METSENINEFAAALAASQASFGKLIASKQGKIEGKSKKSGKEFSYSYTYANLADALSACRETLNMNGIAIYQDAATSDRSGVEITTMLMHSSGQWIKGSPLFMPVSGGAQDVGSAITYGRRYGLLAAAGMAPEDDDGAAAQGAKPKNWGSKTPPATRQRKPRRTPAAAPDGEPLCTGKAAHIAIANTKHRADYSSASGNPPEAVWRAVLKRAGVPPTDNGQAPEPEQLTVKHGLAVRDLLKSGIAAIEAGDDQRQPGEDDPAEVEPPADWTGHGGQDTDGDRGAP